MVINTGGIDSVCFEDYDEQSAVAMNAVGACMVVWTSRSDGLLPVAGPVSCS